MEPGIDTVVSEAFTASLDELPLPEIRARRNAAQRLENAVSYARRLAQGRLDILRTEFERRGRGDAVTGDLLAELHDSLEEGRTRNPPEYGIPRRAPQDLEPPAEADTFVADLDDAAGPGFLARAENATDSEIADAVARLADFERTISDRRRALHTTLDRIQAELVRRYRDGEVDPGSVLGS